MAAHRFTLIFCVLLGACSGGSGTSDPSAAELGSRLNAEICAGSKVARSYSPNAILAEEVIVTFPSKACRNSFYASLKKSAEYWEHPFGDSRQILGRSHDRTLFTTTESGKLEVLITVTPP